MKRAFGPWTGMRRACSPWFLRTRANPGASPQAGMKRAFGPWTGMRRAFGPWTGIPTDVWSAESAFS